jgi:hypothetical protein
MAGIVPSLFGPTPQELESQRRQQQADLLKAYAAQGPRAAAGAGVGTLIGQGLNALFGTQDPEIKKATDVYKVLQTTQQELGDGVSDPNILYPTLQKRFTEAGLPDVAAKVAEEGASKIIDWNTKQADIAKKKDELAREQGFNADLKQAQIDKGDVPLTPDEIAKIGLKYGTRKDIMDWAGKEDYRNMLIENKAKDLEIKYLKESGKMTDKEKLDYQNKLNKDFELFKSTIKGDKPLTGREARYADNVAIAGNEAIAGINNIVNLPKTVTGGFWGAGLPKMQSGKGLFEAPIGALKNSMTKETTQRYNAEIKNIGKYYSTLRNGGLAATNDDINSFEDQFRINENDKPLTALTKLAQMRQTFERAAEIKVLSANTPKEQKELWKDWLEQVKVAIPITVNDINQIANEKDKTKTFATVLAETRAKSDKLKGVPPQEAINELKSNPKLANKFDEVFGQGASAKYLKE